MIKTQAPQEAAPEPEGNVTKTIPDLLDMSPAEQAAEYYRLCDQRDAVYKRAKPLEDELSKINADIEKLRTQAEVTAKKIEATWASVGDGPSAWVRFKKRISSIVKLLGGQIPPRVPPDETKTGA